MERNRQGKRRRTEDREETAQQGPASSVSTWQMTNRGLISKVTDGKALSEQSTSVNVRTRVYAGCPRNCKSNFPRVSQRSFSSTWLLSLPTLVLVTDNPNGGGSGLFTLLEELSHRSRSVMPLKSLSKDEVRFLLISPLKQQKHFLVTQLILILVVCIRSFE